MSATFARVVFTLALNKFPVKLVWLITLLQRLVMLPRVYVTFALGLTWAANVVTPVPPPNTVST